MMKYDTVLILVVAYFTPLAVLYNFPLHGGARVSVNTPTIAIDLDGTTRLPGGKSPFAPPRPLARILHDLRRAGYAIAGATGASLDSARHAEKHLSLRFDVLAHSYCWRLLNRRQQKGRTQFVLVPEQEHRTVVRLSSRLDDICRRHRGIRDDHVPCFTKFLPCERSFDAACEEVTHVLAGIDEVRMLANRCDFGITVVCRSATKSRAVEWLLEHHYHITVAAGDTKSDLPLLEAADFPIVTLTDDGVEPDPALVAVALRKGGYIATEPHGHGLAKGLKIARERGIITF